MTSPHPPASVRSPILYVRAAHTAWRRIGEETVILDQKRHRLVALNSAGGDLWHWLDAPREADNLVSGDISEIRSFLENLADLGLLDRTNDACEPRPANDDVPETAGADGEPAILWQEAVQNAAQTTACAFLSGQNPLCDSVPFS